MKSTLSAALIGLSACTGTIADRPESPAAEMRPGEGDVPGAPAPSPRPGTPPPKPGDPQPPPAAP
jgi:hypothetical protein